MSSCPHFGDRLSGRGSLTVADSCLGAHRLFLPYARTSWKGNSAKSIYRMREVRILRAPGKSPRYPPDLQTSCYLDGWVFAILSTVWARPGLGSCEVPAFQSI